MVSHALVDQIKHNSRHNEWCAHHTKPAYPTQLKADVVVVLSHNFSSDSSSSSDDDDDNADKESVVALEQESEIEILKEKKGNSKFRQVFLTGR
jgi:hypothetical protein